MSHNVARRLRLLAATSCLAAGLVAPAFAQLAPPAPVRKSIDGNGVNLFDGTFNVSGPTLSMGQGQQGLTYYKINYGGGWTDNLQGGLNLAGTTLTVSLGAFSDRFTVSSGIYTNTEGNGSTLTYNSSGHIYTYTRADGTVAHFDKDMAQSAPYFSNEGGITDLIAPSAGKLKYSYQNTLYCKTYKPGGMGDICTQEAHLYRLTSIANSYGYVINLTYNYDYEYDPGTPASQPDFYAWANVVGVTGNNLAVTGGSTPSQTFGGTYEAGTGYYQVFDTMGRLYKYRFGAGATVAGVKLPGSASEDVALTYTGTRVTAVTTPAGTTNYASSDAAGIRTVTVTDPLSHVTTYKFNIASQRMTEVTDANSHTTTMQYDASGRLTRTTAPEGNYVQLTYDSRGNVTERRAVSKTPGTPADIVTTASFPASCTNPKTCNQPTWTKDARNNQTDYTYDSGHGGVLTVTSPAPTVGGTRPQTRYSYSTLQAYYLIGGSIVASGEPVTLLSGTSTCQTGVAPACVGTADEVKTTIGYGPQVAGTGNNLLPVSTSSGAGDNSLTATTTMSYDDVGNLTYSDGPLPGTADTSRTLYNANRETIGAISPDPDGASSLPNRAVRITIDPRGLVTKQERGTTAGQSDAAWAAFSPAEAVDIGYDSSRRVTTSRLSNGATVYALTQTSYDAAGRTDCVATRMNPAVYGSLPASACTLGTTGSFGPDRISKTLYDNANQVTAKQVAVGTADAATEATLTYTNNGKLSTLKDGENNLTTYEYDGHDRLSKTRYPLPTQGSNASSATDYEQLGYDATSNVTSRRLRDATSIAFTYDNLNRPTLKNLPGSEPDVTYTYDNLGRLTGASQTGNALTFTYDALSRNLTQVGPQGTVSSQWNLGGRRTRLTYPGAGLYVDYDYLVTGEMTRIRENGASSGVGVLATYAYDNLGHRSSLTFGNGVVQAYGFDPVSRLASLTNDLASTANDLSATFAYNPASQIASTVRTGDNYAWTDHFNTNVTGTANGLNQLTAVGPKTLAHDTRGNVTAFGTKSFTYGSENLLLTGPGSTTLSYDPGMRLYQSVSGGTTLRLAYDGLDRIAEYDGSNALQRRYVHGPSMDEPLVQYEGSGTTDRRFMSSDERGSIISLTDSSGTLLGINKYDEYGNPQSTNIGTFGYTGQAWLPGANIWYYKARDYDPELGRFLQTDPIDVAGGINLYAYVGNGPVNSSDPLGLECVNADVCVIAPDIVVTGRRESHTDKPPADTSKPMPDAPPVGGSEGSDGPDATVEAPVNCGLHPSDPRCRPAPPSPPSPPIATAMSVKIAANSQTDQCGSKGSEWVPDGIWGGACQKHDICYGTKGKSKEGCDLGLILWIKNECAGAGVSCFGIGMIYGFVLMGAGVPGGPSRKAYNSAQGN